MLRLLGLIRVMIEVGMVVISRKVSSMLIMIRCGMCLGVVRLLCISFGIRNCVLNMKIVRLNIGIMYCYWFC